MQITSLRAHLNIRARGVTPFKGRHSNVTLPGERANPTKYPPPQNEEPSFDDLDRKRIKRRVCGRKVRNAARV